ncbi:MAG: tryptophan synthase subunit alpha [Gemmatimonadota bacterium]|nr:MAG: tryptophan synthase subunit alpha [Gemmatimonadota bacterium]
MPRSLEEEHTIRLNHAIADANDNGRLGLIIYIIPGFPSVREYQATLDLLDQTAAVSIVETTIPVEEGFSDHANETIRRAHIQAASSTDWEVTPRPTKPALCVLYKSTSDTRGFETVLVDTLGQFEGLILEWAEEDESPYIATARKRGLELVQCIGPWMSPGTVRRIVERAEDEPLIYLMSAPMTGAELFSNQQLSSCIFEAKKHRPAAKVAAGFGIGSGEDVRRLAEIEELDAVIIGTAFLKALGTGLEAAKALLADVEPALKR